MVIPPHSRVRTKYQLNQKLLVIMKEIMTDEDLFAALKKGNRHALAQFYHQVVPGLKVYSVKIVKDQEMAHEIAIIKVCVCLQKIHGFETYDDWKKYLFKSIKNRCLNYLRDKKRQGPGDISCDPDDMDLITTPDIIREIIISEVQGFTLEIIAGISGKRRGIAIRTLIEGWSSKELAELYKESKSSIDSERNRAKTYIVDFFKKNWFKMLF